MDVVVYPHRVPTDMVKMSQTDIGLGVSAPMCLGVLQHTQINVHGCPATVTPHWPIVTGLTYSTAMGTGHYIVVVERKNVWDRLCQ